MFDKQMCKEWSGDVCVRSGVVMFEVCVSCLTPIYLRLVF